MSQGTRPSHISVSDMGLRLKLELLNLRDVANITLLECIVSQGMIKEREDRRGSWNYEDDGFSRVWRY